MKLKIKFWIKHNFNNFYSAPFVNPEEICVSVQDVDRKSRQSVDNSGIFVDEISRQIKLSMETFYVIEFYTENLTIIETLLKNPEEFFLSFFRLH